MMNGCNGSSKKSNKNDNTKAASEAPLILGSELTYCNATFNSILDFYRENV